MRALFFLLLGICGPLLPAQTIKGVVTNDEDVILPGAQVWVLGREDQAVFTDRLGDYALSWPKGADSCRLVARFVGYRPDTLLLRGPTYRHIRLQALEALETVVVQDRREGQYLYSLTPVKTEVISAAELTKGACCDLAGCFNTNATVQAATTNVVTNAKELRILGLAGVYNQVLLDGFPLFQAASYTYGMSTLPGPLVENIYISKGANSVLQGWDGISGQINVETKTPADGPQAFGNAYVNSFGERQFNAYATQRGERVQNLLAAHVVLPADRIDRDGDGFLDLPLLQRFSIYDRLQIGDPELAGWSASAGFRFVREERLGGQSTYRPDRHEGSGEVYGQVVRFSQPEFWSRVAWRLDERRRIVGFLSGQVHDQGAWYGLMRYRAGQRMANATVQYERRSTRGHELRMGLSGRWLDLDETLDFGANPLSLPQDGSYRREDRIGGAFAEQISYFLDNRLTWILGLRYDHHQVFGGRFTPRTLLKWDPWSHTSLRGSLGYGWRMANVFTENVFLLASNRRVLFTETLRPEAAWNAGLNLTRNLTLGRFTGRLGMDVYETRFRNQIFPEYNLAPDLAIVANFGGTSVSRALQSDLDLNHPSGWQIKLAYNYLEVYRETETGREILPFNPEHRVLGVVSLAPPSRPWQADMHAHWYGRQHLPRSEANPEIHRRPLYSDPYSTVTVQFTWRFTTWEIYGGCENILDFRQERPILGWQDPFGPYFDTAFAWGPTRGREFYLGLRWRLP
jgi:outer membrane receptor for ferrienterochelin and colicins